MTDSAAEVRAAVAATRAAGTARYEHVHRFDFDGVALDFQRLRDKGRSPSDGSLRGDLRRAGRGLTDIGLRAAGRALARALQNPDVTTTTGVIDFAARRYVTRKGETATLVAPDGVRLAAADGTWEATPDRDAPGTTDSMIWLVDLLAGTTAATETGTESVRGVACRAFDVRCDLALASSETPGKVPAPDAHQFEDLLALPARVWLADGVLRRVERVHGEANTHELDLFDHGAAVDPAVWERRPGD